MWKEDVLKIFPSLMNDYSALLICHFSSHLRHDHSEIVYFFWAVIT